MDCSFSAFCKLRPQDVLLIGGTPLDQCKCETHENFFLKLDATGYTNEKTFWEEILCGVSENSQCWLSECDLFRDGQKFKPQKLWMQ